MAGALSHLARKAFLTASRRLAKALNLLNPSPTVSQVMGSKNGRCDGVDGARAASGSMKGRAKMVVVKATV